MKNKDDKTITLKDTLIENNVVDSCSLVGIVMGHYEGGEKGTGTVIRGNYVSNCLGDGIILFNDKVFRARLSGLADTLLSVPTPRNSICVRIFPVLRCSSTPASPSSRSPVTAFVRPS